MPFHYESGVVKFFQGQAGKRFGFITPDPSSDDTREVFFHYNNGGYYVGSGAAGGGATPLRDPKKGDRVVFERKFLETMKGPSASTWYFEDQYLRKKEVETLPVTIEGAIILLAECERIECTELSANRMRIEWRHREEKVATGEFDLLFMKHFEHGATMTITPTDPKWKTTIFRNLEAAKLRELGTLLQARHLVAALWNNSWCTYVVDASSYRNLTEEEKVRRVMDDPLPTLNKEWLRCEYFTSADDRQSQVVRILRRVDGNA